MKKLCFIFVFVVLFISIFPFYSFAFTQPVTINSPMVEPVVSLSADGSSLSYYFIFYENNPISGQSNYKIQIWNCTSISGSTWELTNGAFYRITCSNPFSVTCENYDAESGILLGINYYNSSFGGIIQKEYIDCPPQLSGTAIDCFYINLPDNVTSNLDSNTKYTNVPFINFSSIVPYIHSYTSYLSEPISDPYNRYIVLGGEEEQYIYLLSFSLSDLTMFDSQSINQGGDEVDLSFNNVFIPCIKLDNNQLKLEIDVDPQIFYILNNTNNLYKYSLMLAKYRLLDGQYISSTLYNGSISSSVTSLSFDFGNVNDYDSIKTYGVKYIDELTSNIHYNLLKCSWGHDPDFEIWQENVLFYLQGIYDSFVDNSDEVTFPPDENVSSEIDNYVSQEDQFFSDFDEANSNIDNVFNEAASVFTDNSNGFAFIRMLMENFIFSIPSSYVIVFISLSFGLVILFLGRTINKK